MTGTKAQRLRELHRGPGILVLPNAWDVASARVFERAGARAIATTSAGVANSLGYPDGEAIPVEEMLAVIERIARAVEVPVTADLEAGYGDAAATARGALAVGAVGMNLEDGPGSVEQHVARVRAVREAVGDALVLNARVDVLLRGTGDADEAIARANAYLDAGADCAYVIGVSDAKTIGRLAREIRGPLNVLAGAATPPVAELERLGVRRVSVGPWPFRATTALAQRIAEELLQRGTYSSFVDAAPYPDLNRLLAG